VLHGLLSLLSSSDPPSPNTVTAPSGAPALVSYVAFAASIVAALGVGIGAISKAVSSYRSRGQRGAEVDHTVAQTGQVTAGITLQGWQESRQEVKDARDEAKVARERAERAEKRADSADKRADIAERDQRKTEKRVDALEEVIHELNERIAACNVTNPPGCPLKSTIGDL
jgi:hypothetical protein